MIGTDANRSNLKCQSEFGDEKRCCVERGSVGRAAGRARVQSSCLFVFLYSGEQSAAGPGRQPSHHPHQPLTSHRIFEPFSLCHTRHVDDHRACSNTGSRLGEKFRCFVPFCTILRVLPFSYTHPPV